MCIDFDGHHSGGSSFVYVNLVQFKIFCIFVLNVFFYLQITSHYFTITYYLLS